MRLAVQPENPLEAIALQTRKELQPFLLALLGMGVSHSMIATVRLGLFDTLNNRPQTAIELADTLSCDLHGMQVLLDSLDSFGLIQRQGDRYQLGATAAQHLTQSGGSIYDFLKLGGDIQHQMILLEEDVRTGQVPNFHFDPQSATCALNYYTMLKSSSQQRSPEVLKWAKLDNPQRLLDVAGGSAEYSIAFCQKYPDLKADILDLPNAIAARTPRIAEAGLGDRIRYIEGNLLDSDWGNDYDVIFLSNILHCLTAAHCQLAIQKAFQALRPGGTVLINDVFHPGSQGNLSTPISLFSLIYYITCGRRSWPQFTIQQWLTNTGFTNLRTAKQHLAVLASGSRPG
jgi:ubiquinone/menaquinone biosynthesis C-methylase UbiE